MTAILDAAVAQAPVSVVVLRGPELVVEVANAQALQNWGRSSAATIIGLPLFEAVPELAGQGFEAVLERVRTTRVPFVGSEMPLVVTDQATGERVQRYIDRTYSMLDGTDHLLAIGFDVTASVLSRRTREAALENQERRIEHLREAGLFGTCEVDFASSALRADPLVATMFELPTSPAYSLEHVLARVVETERARVTAQVTGAGQHKLDVEFPIAVATGMRWLTMRGTFELFEDGQPRKLYALVGDTTRRHEQAVERDQLLADVRRVEHRLHAQFMQAPVAVAVVSARDFVYEHANPAYLEMIGRTEIVGKPIAAVFPELPPDAPLFQMLQELVRTKQAFRADEFMVPIADSTGRPVETFFKFSCQPILAEDGGVEAIMAVAVDVSEPVRARQRIEALACELKLADQRKDEFLAMLAHELRNPMAAVSTAIQLLEQVEGDATRSAKYRETGKRQMANLVRLVDDLLDVSRITRGKIELQSHELELGGIVQQALSSTRAAFEARGHSLSVTLDAGGFRMMGDATRLEQIVVNLLTNAAKYTDPNGRVEVHLGREARAAGGSDAVLRVRDTGRGIPADMLDRVFELFVQVSPSIDRRTGGLGLGLTLVKRLAEMHGGHVTATSAGAGKGSEFVVRLPLLERSAVGTPLGMPVVELPGLTPRRILLVEDADDVRDTLSAYLRGLGHEVHVARDGLEGVARLAELHPDVAFVDIGLPGLDGFEVARRARIGGHAQYMVALTGYGGAEARAQAHAAGFDLHLTKPVDLASLPRVIDRAGKGSGT